MKIADSQNDLGNHELRLIFRKSLLSQNMTEKITTLDKLQNEKDSIIILEHILHANEEWVLKV